MPRSDELRVFCSMRNASRVVVFRSSTSIMIEMKSRDMYTRNAYTMAPSTLISSLSLLQEALLALSQPPHLRPPHEFFVNRPCQRRRMEVESPLRRPATKWKDFWLDDFFQGAGAPSDMTTRNDSCGLFGYADF